MSGATLRGAANVAGLVVETALGAWLLFLFLLALAWDPLDRRLGFRARRYAERLSGGSDEPPAEDAGHEAFGIGPAPTRQDQS